MNAMSTWAGMGSTMLGLHPSKLVDVSQLWSGTWVAALVLELRNTDEEQDFLMQHVPKGLRNCCPQLVGVQPALRSLVADVWPCGCFAPTSQLSVSLPLLWTILHFCF